MGNRKRDNRKRDNRKCAVLVPIGNAIEPETESALNLLAQRGYVVRTLRGSSQVDLARSSLASEALRDGFEETFWIDADQSFDPDDVDRIRSLALPFVACFYPCKGPKRLAGKLKSDSGAVRFGKGGSIVEVEYCGMGFTYVRAEVYLGIQQGGLPLCGGGYDGKVILPFFLPLLLEPAEDDGSMPCYLSEDYSFCVRARRAGFAPMVDTRIKVGHIGKKTYTWDDLAPERPLESVTVAMKPSGAIEIFSSTARGIDMGIEKAELLSEQACLDQQAAQHRERIANADAVKAAAFENLKAVEGAQQMVNYLLAKIEAKEKPPQVADGPSATATEIELQRLRDELAAKSAECERLIEEDSQRLQEELKATATRGAALPANENGKE